MKNNVIWVDFTTKNKSKNKPKNFFSNIISSIKDLFVPSTKYHHNPKRGDNYHKSIL